MFCPQCGKELPASSKFCPYCGYKVASSSHAGVSTSIDNSVRSQPQSDAKLPSDHGESAKKKRQSFVASHIKAICIIIVSIAVVFCVGFITWTSVSFPGVDKSDIFESLYVSKMTTQLSLGNTFNQDDFAITPVGVTYVSSSICYDEYGDPYASVVLDITCFSGTWEPKYEAITFWLDGSAAFSQPDFERIQIKRGETACYTFSQPLITSSTQDVDMRFMLECKTGAVVELYFSVDGIQEFFDGGDSYNDHYIINDYSGTWCSEGTIPWDSGITLELQIEDFSDDQWNTYVYVSSVSDAPSMRVAAVESSEIVDKGSIISITFDDDEWGNSGVLELTLLDDGLIGISCKIETYSDDAMWDLGIPYTILYPYTGSLYE